jgi:hypothetical protein
MPQLISAPTRIAAAGSKPKVIEEFVGRVNTGDEKVSIARMISPEGWVEPGQTPEFDEYTLVLEGALHVKHRGRGVGAIQLAKPWWSCLYRGVFAGVFARNRAP